MKANILYKISIPDKKDRYADWFAQGKRIIRGIVIKASVVFF